MGDEKVHRETIIDQPSMTSVVTKEYLVLPFTDVVVHKQFFEFLTVFVFVATSALWAIGLWTTWYQQLIILMYAVVLKFWYLFAGFAMLVLASGYVHYWASHRKR